MSLNLFGCVCGQFHSPAAGLGMEGGRVSVPVPFYVVEHPDGIALFDCGMHLSLRDPTDRFRLALQSQNLDVTFDEQDTVTSHLHRLNIDPARVKYVVVSHLHFDHVSGIHQIPNASIVVQRREWEAGFDDELANRYFLRRRFFDLGHEVKLIDGEHDLFGDGTVTCIPSFGHTPGHQSLRVRGNTGDYILVADACYNSNVVKTRNFPAYSDQSEMNRSLDKLLALRGSNTAMIFGHDPDQWGTKAILRSTRS